MLSCCRIQTFTYAIPVSDCSTFSDTVIDQWMQIGDSLILVLQNSSFIFLLLLLASIDDHYVNQLFHKGFQTGDFFLVLPFILHVLAGILL